MHAVREGFPKEAVMLSSVIVLFDTPSARTPNDDCKITKKNNIRHTRFYFFWLSVYFHYLCNRFLQTLRNLGLLFKNV